MSSGTPWARRNDAEEAVGLLTDVLDLPLEITPSEQLVRSRS